MDKKLSFVIVAGLFSALTLLLITWVNYDVAKTTDTYHLELKFHGGVFPNSKTKAQAKKFGDRRRPVSPLPGALPYLPRWTIREAIW